MAKEADQLTSDLELFLQLLSQESAAVSPQTMEALFHAHLKLHMHLLNGSWTANVGFLSQPPEEDLPSFHWVLGKTAHALFMQLLGVAVVESGEQQG